MSRAAIVMRTTVVLALFSLASAAFTADEAQPTPEPPSQFESLVKEAGLPYMMISEDTALFVQTGTAIRNHIMYARVLDTGDIKALCVYEEVANVEDQRDWPAEIFPWLLVQNGMYVRGSFALGEGGLVIVAIEKLGYEGLTGKSLLDALSCIHAMTENSYRDVMQFLKK